MSQFELLRLLFDGLLALAAGAAWIYAWRARREQVTHDQIERVRAEADMRLMTQASQIAALEAKLDGVPRLAAVHELALLIKELAGDVKALTSRLDGTVSIVERVESATARQEEYIHDLVGTIRETRHDGR